MNEYLKPNSWTHNALGFLGIILRLEVFTLQTSFKPFLLKRGGGGKIRLQRLLWIARRKTFKTLVQNTSKNSASGEESKFVSQFSVCFSLFALSAFSWPLSTFILQFRMHFQPSVCPFNFQCALSAFSLLFQLSVCPFSFQFVLSVCSLSFQFALSAFRSALRLPFQLSVCTFGFPLAYLQFPACFFYFSLSWKTAPLWSCTYVCTYYVCTVCIFSGLIYYLF